MSEHSVNAVFLTGVKRRSPGITGGQLKFLNKDQLREIDYASKEVRHLAIIIKLH